MIEHIIKTALDAGQAILEVYGRDFEVEFKADESPLTEADLASHHIIAKGLAETPYPVLSEESGDIPYDVRAGWETYWLVDPLDGTREFVKRNGEFTVNIALIDRGVPVLGVVYAPVLDVLYCGMSDVGSRKWDVESGKTAWKADHCSRKSLEELLAAIEPLSTSNIPLSTMRGQRAAPLRVVASKSHCNDETLRFITALENEFGPVERVSCGSSLKLCMVAEGSADIYPRIAPTMEWDTAAAHAVVAAAGGQVFVYDPALPISSFVSRTSEVGSGTSEVGSGTADVGRGTSDGERGMLEVGSGTSDGERGTLEVGSGTSEVGSGTSEVGSGTSEAEVDTSHPTSHLPPSTTTHPTSHLPPPTTTPPTSKKPRALHYNKENLLNPYFVVSGLIE
jgi:3'(2'), 5'-bisphosphate nucleotidase